MAKSLERRVRNLEDRGSKECLACGFDGDWSKVEFEVVWDDLVVSDGQSEPHAPIESVEPERCELCGTALELIVTWHDLPEPVVPWDDAQEDR